MAIVSGEHSGKPMLVDSNVLFEKLFEFSPDAVLVVDREGAVLRANQQAETMFGHPRAELIGQPVERLLPERFGSGHPRHRDAYATQPHTWPMGAGLELYGLRKDGTEFPVDIMLSPLQVKEQPLVLAVVRDITRRKIAEQERDLQAKLAREQAALLELAHDSIIVRDLDNRITFWSRGAEEKYGWKRAEVLGKLAHTLLETQFPQSAESVDEALRRNHYWEGEVIHKKKTGGRIVVASRRVLQMDADGKPAAIFEINNDVTDRKKTEEALQRSEQRLRSLFEFSPDAIVVTDRDGRIADANAQLEKFFGSNVRNSWDNSSKFSFQSDFAQRIRNIGRTTWLSGAFAPWARDSNCMADARMAANSRWTSCSGPWKEPKARWCSVSSAISRRKRRTKKLSGSASNRSSIWKKNSRSAISSMKLSETAPLSNGF